MKEGSLYRMKEGSGNLDYFMEHARNVEMQNCLQLP